MEEEEDVDFVVVVSSGFWVPPRKESIGRNGDGDDLDAIAPFCEKRVKRRIWNQSRRVLLLEKG